MVPFMLKSKMTSFLRSDKFVRSAIWLSLRRFKPCSLSLSLIFMSSDRALLNLSLWWIRIWTKTKWRSINLFVFDRYMKMTTLAKPKTMRSSPSLSSSWNPTLLWSNHFNHLDRLWIFGGSSKNHLC
jgi:hypothetical protein